jgi:hypothetical protein
MDAIPMVVFLDKIHGVTDEPIIKSRFPAVTGRFLPV